MFLDGDIYFGYSHVDLSDLISNARACFNHILEPYLCIGPYLHDPLCVIFSILV